MILKLKGTRVLRQIEEAVRNNYKIIQLQGGSRSSKTYSIFQHLIKRAIAGDKLTITIARDKLTWIKSTLLKDFQEITQSMGVKVTPEINPNRQDQIYSLNGTEFAFFGLDYPQKLHGRKQNIAWLNEAMESSKASFDQLEMRTTDYVILDYNPADDEHWVFDLPKRDDVKLIKSTMLDNPFLPDTIIKKIRSYEPTDENIKNGTSDNYMWQVYGLGEKAKLQGAIFPSFEILDELPKQVKFLGIGLDFGYSQDETAIVELYTIDDQIIFNELLYQTGLTNQDIVQHLDRLEVNRLTEIYADSSEPKSIEEIRRSGFNIKPVEKGADSINFGINLMKTFKICITKKSINLEKELRKYKWQEDRMGKILPKPVDAYNHIIDSARYVSMMKLKKKPSVTFHSDDYYF